MPTSLPGAPRSRSPCAPGYSVTRVAESEEGSRCGSRCWEVARLAGRRRGVQRVSRPGGRHVAADRLRQRRLRQAARAHRLRRRRRRRDQPPARGPLLRPRPVRLRAHLRAAPAARAGRPLAGHRRTPRGPRCTRRPGAREAFRQVCAGGGIPRARRERLHAARVRGRRRARGRAAAACASAPVPHFIPTFAVESSRRRRAASPSAPTTRPATRSSTFARGTDLLLIEATLPRPERGGVRGHLTPAEAGEHAARAGAKRLVLTHISDELDALGARPGRGAFGGPVEVADGGARLRGLSLGRRRPRSSIARVCDPSATSSPTSSACAARWTSCSATSSARGLHPRRRRLLPGRRRLLREPDRRRAAARGRARRARRHRPDEISLEIEGRELVLAGHRRAAEADGRVYQQLEIDFGPFRRVIPLGPTSSPTRRARPTATASCASSCRSPSPSGAPGRSRSTSTRRRARP